MDKMRFKDDPDRRRRLALLLTWRMFRHSIARGRPMTLPNLLRLYQRCHAEHCPGEDIANESALLRQYYLAHQPFRAHLPRLRPSPRRY